MITTCRPGRHQPGCGMAVTQPLEPFTTAPGGTTHVPAPVSPWTRRAASRTLPPSAHGARAYAR